MTYDRSEWSNVVFFILILQKRRLIGSAKAVLQIMRAADHSLHDRRRPTPPSSRTVNGFDRQESANPRVDWHRRRSDRLPCRFRESLTMSPSRAHALHCRSRRPARPWRTCLPAASSKFPGHFLRGSSTVSRRRSPSRLAHRLRKPASNLIPPLPGSLCSSRESMQGYLSLLPG